MTAHHHLLVQAPRVKTKTAKVIKIAQPHRLGVQRFRVSPRLSKRDQYIHSTLLTSANRHELTFRLERISRTAHMPKVIKLDENVKESLPAKLDFSREPQ